MSSVFDPQVTKAVALGIASALLLRYFYRVVSSEWPRHYFSAKTTIEEHSRSNLIRYLLLRLLPVFVFAVLVGVIAQRNSAHPGVAITTLALTHWCTSTFVAMYRPWRHDRRGLSPLVWMYHVTSTAGIVTAALVAALTFEEAQGAIPDGGDAINALWTAALAAIFAAALRHALELRVREPVDLVQRARRDIGEETWDSCVDAAASYGTDPDLLRAIIAAEALQRPKWARRLEWLGGRIVGPGTYGVAQMQATGPITDRASVELLAASLGGRVPRVDKYGNLPKERTRRIIEKHNSRPEFVDQVFDIYQELLPHPAEKSNGRAADGRPTIEVLKVTRDGEEWVISGTASVHEGNLHLVVQDTVTPVHVWPGAPQRGCFQIQLPLTATHARLVQPDESDGEGSPQSVEIDLRYR